MTRTDAPASDGRQAKPRTTTTGRCFVPNFVSGPLAQILNAMWPDVLYAIVNEPLIGLIWAVTMLGATAALAGYLAYLLWPMVVREEGAPSSDTERGVKSSSRPDS